MSGPMFLTAAYDAYVEKALEQMPWLSTDLTPEVKERVLARRYRIEQGNRLRWEDILKQTTGVLADVVTIHSPNGYGYCEACSEESEGYEQDPRDWPCATIRIIEAALS